MDILEAIQNNDIEALRRLLRAGADPNSRDAEGSTLLGRAVWHGHRKMVRVLLEAGADVNAADTDGSTALIGAAEVQDAALVRVLLEAGADVNAKDGNGNTALHDAASWGKLEVVRLLTATGADLDAVRRDGSTALGCAMLWGNRRILTLLLDAGAKPDVPGAESPLLKACMLGQTGVIRALIAAGADVNHTTECGVTPLLNAITCNDGLSVAQRQRNVRLLLAAGADPNATYRFRPGDIMADVHPSGTTALMAAVKQGCAGIVRALLAAGADPRAADARGQNAMGLAEKGGFVKIVAHLARAGACCQGDAVAFHAAALVQAAKEGDLPTVRQCLDAGADPNAPGLDSAATARTALEHAAEGGHAEVVRLLLQAGADPRPAQDAAPGDTGGTTALHLAVASGSADTVRAFLEAGVDPDLRGASRATPLLEAADSGYATVADSLIAAGADVDAEGADTPVTPLLAAIGNHHDQTVAVLLAAGARLDGTVLAAACRHGAIAVVRAALAAGVPVSEAAPRREGGGGASPEAASLTVPLVAAAAFQASYTVRGGKTDVTAARSNRPWLARAEAEQLAILRLLLAAGADANAADGLGRTALLVLARSETIVSVRTDPDRGSRHICSEMDPCPAAQLLLDAGADVNVRDHAGDTPLLAALAGSRMGPDPLPLVRLLISRGAEANARDSLGRTPLILAMESRGACSAALVRVLLDVGALVNAADREGTTALLRAVAARQPLEVLRPLVAAGADVSARDVQGNSVLTLAADNAASSEVRSWLLGIGAVDPKSTAREFCAAARSGDRERVAALLAGGADPNEPYRDVTPLEAAVGAGRVAVVSDLLAAGAEVDGPGNNSAVPGTPLLQAAQVGNGDLILILLAAGADPNARDARGCSAMLYAAWAGCRQGVDALVEAGAKSDDITDCFLEVLRFSDAADTPRFRTAVSTVAAVTGVSAKALEVERLKGAVYFHLLANDEADSLVASGAEAYTLTARWRAEAEKMEAALQRVRESCLAQGCLAVDLGRAGVCADGRLLGLFPTTDLYVVMAAVGTRDNEGEKSTPELIAWFKQLECEHPFTLNQCTFDTVDITFLAPVADPPALAKRLYAFCSDMVDQGVGTVDALAECLRKTRRAHFWWD